MRKPGVEPSGPVAAANEVTVRFMETLNRGTAETLTSDTGAVTGSRSGASSWNVGRSMLPAETSRSTEATMLRVRTPVDRGASEQRRVCPVTAEPGRHSPGSVDQVRPSGAVAMISPPTASPVVVPTVTP